MTEASNASGCGRVDTMASVHGLDRVLFVGSRPEAAKFKPVRNLPHAWVKPGDGGLWTSTPHPTNGCAWIDWCVTEGFGGGPPFTMWELIPHRDAAVFVVDSLRDLEALHDQFGAADSLHLKGLDFEAIGREYDALHLTDEGQWRTRLSMPHNLYGWDCESTLWFRWVFEQVNGPIEFTPEVPDAD